MIKIIFALSFLLSLNANATLLINCKATSANIQVRADLESSTGKVQVFKDGKLVYTNTGITTYKKTWESITLDATKTTDEIQNGIKIYFESARTPVGLRPYGETSQKLTPGEDGITMYGMNCDQDYETIKKEVLGLISVGDETEYSTQLVKTDGTTLNFKTIYRVLSYDDSTKLFKFEMETDQSRSTIDLPENLTKAITHQANQVSTYDDGTKITRTLVSKK